jgi:DNA-binding response OmpR family regulator
MSADKQLLDTLVVVDAKPDDYEPLVAALACDAVRVQLFATGEDALRAAETRHVEMWMINMRLPDMSGIGLLKLIRRRLRRSVVFLVGDVYSAEDELAARTEGATAYQCKPPSATWLEAFQPRCRGPTPAEQRKSTSSP